MGALSKILRNAEGGRLLFWCPGCNSSHQIAHGEGPGPRWGWNGSAETPTFTPSVLVTGRDFTEKGWADYEAWCASGHPDLAGKAFDSVDVRCHSFVTNGQIQFLSDCTHKLAGQTVPLAEFPESFG